MKKKLWKNQKRRRKSKERKLNFSGINIEDIGITSLLNEPDRLKIETLSKMQNIPKELQNEEDYKTAKKLFQEKYPIYKLMFSRLNENDTIFSQLNEAYQKEKSEKKEKIKKKIQKLYEVRKPEIDELTIKHKNLHNEMESCKKNIEIFVREYKKNKKK